MVFLRRFYDTAPSQVLPIATSGGTSKNTVPERARYEIDLRFETLGDGRELLARVEEAGVARWIAARAGTDAHARLAAEQVRADRLRSVFVQLVRDARAELAAVYASEATDAARHARKAAAFASMRAAYEAAKAGEAGLAGYDRWFAGHDGRGPNNASLASVALYDEKVPAFRALLARSGGDLPRFYAEVRDLAKRPKPEREAMLARAAGG